MKPEETQKPQQEGILGGITKQITGITKQLGGFDLADPLGVCKNDYGGFHLCNNIQYSKGNWRIPLIILAIVVVFFADFFDILAWAIGWIPVLGDIIGNTVLGNVIDVIALVVLAYLIGFPAFFGIGEFVDVLGFIPVIGDIAGLIEWLPAWTFAIIIYGIFQFLKTNNNKQSPVLKAFA